ncbi:MAG: hypothetical protein RR621_05930 [Lachnospiraceae bacterium]
MENLLNIDKQKRMILTVLVIAVFLSSSFALLGFRHSHQFSLKEKRFVVELGQAYSTKPAHYIKGSENILKHTTLNLQMVDATKPGIYKVSATYNHRKLDFEIQIKDSVAPGIILSANPMQVVVGKEIPGSTILRNVTDPAGVKAIRFSDNQIALASDTPDNVLSTIGLKFDKIGEQKITVTAIDFSGNEREKEITFIITEDYEAHVSGFHDFVVEQGAAVDWMEGIVKDDMVLEVAVNANAVDLNLPGEYTLIYLIKGNDQKTIIEKPVHVTVIESTNAPLPAHKETKIQIPANFNHETYYEPDYSYQEEPESNVTPSVPEPEKPPVEVPPSGGGTTPPDSGGGTTPPGGDTNPPSGGGDTVPPDGGGTVPKE